MNTGHISFIPWSEKTKTLKRVVFPSRTTTVICESIETPTNLNTETFYNIWNLKKDHIKHIELDSNLVLNVSIYILNADEHGINIECDEYTKNLLAATGIGSMVRAVLKYEVCSFIDIDNKENKAKRYYTTKPYGISLVVEEP